ncbi:hypothetical protein E4100_07980 [Soehngenia longivitae]|uniref:Uncharacterized protein n=1 Tax=Soehngenia longivitae TaxID=2562294 RepID=A0A4Z0D2J4_9FIRM|nr:hypothetical protein [Soehngenia longivitae]TFZ39555.1 hypothetical protein E4100_07980 [Soehngenia longivitae]
MFDFFISLIIMAEVASLFGYVLVVLKEKYYLKKNIILIDNKYISNDEIEDTDLYEFVLDGTKLTAGDEITIQTKTNEKYKGVVIGAIAKEHSIKIITYTNEIIKLRIDTIREFKILGKYGKFFN